MPDLDTAEQPDLVPHIQEQPAFVPLIQAVPNARPDKFYQQNSMVTIKILINTIDKILQKHLQNLGYISFFLIDPLWCNKGCISLDAQHAKTHLGCSK